jgi:Patatin-like phospholipase
LLLAQLAPDFIGDYLHAPGSALLALASLVAVATVWLAILRDVVDGLLAGLRYVFGATGPASLAAGDLIGLVAIIALPLGISYLAEYAGLYDVAPVNRVAQSEDGDPAVAGRPDVKTAVTKYLRCHKAEDQGEDHKVPAIIIASEGGASRSAAWTLSVMRMLDARTGGAVGADLFAVIGVSGGSLGAVTYLMAQATQFPQAASAAPSAAEQAAFWSKPGPANGVVELARADLLSSTVARMFDNDTLLGLPTRGQALEDAFEQFWGWDKGFAMRDLAHGGFLALRQGRDCLPHLILNGTDVETGNRLLTSTIRFGLPAVLQGIDDPIEQPFSAAIDVLYEMNTDIPAAAAVLNSARFPLISPPGMLRTSAVRDAGDDDRLVIDGGVFENFGARDAWELAVAIAKADSHIKPIVLLISNEVDLPAVPKPGEGEQDPEGRCVDKNFDSLNGHELKQVNNERTRTGVAVPEVLTSVFGLYNTRAGHARGEIAVLRQQNCTAPLPTLYQFDLPQPDVTLRQAAPMNWTLDVNTCQFLLGAARRAQFNKEQVAQLRKLLLGPPGDGVGPSDMASEDSHRCDGDADQVGAWPG